MMAEPIQTIMQRHNFGACRMKTSQICNSLLVMPTIE